MAMYIRLKRRNQTIFLHIDPSSTFLQIKQSIGETLNMDASHIMLFASDKKKELIDGGTVSDQEVKSDDIVYMVFQKESGGGWEDIQVEALTHVGSDE